MTILAKMDDAAFFVLHGLTGCGKSQFVNVMRAALGEYAAEAAPSTFQASRFGGGGNGPTDDIHSLRGVRFASVSETEEGEVLKEALLKRVTGGDELTSRTLHQRNITWKPQFTVWMMTNHKPKLSSTDGAIWRRVKPIHFPMNFSESANRELGLSKKIIATELSGVFNWVVEGVREYLRIGLAEPAETTAAIAEYRAEVDPVQTFLTEAADEGRIIIGSEERIKSQELYNVYCDWCRDNNIRYPLATRRFGQRLSELEFDTAKGTNGVRMRLGIRANDSFGSSTGWLSGH
jgi:putative DNA primase/helicase